MSCSPGCSWPGLFCSSQSRSSSRKACSWGESVKSTGRASYSRTEPPVRLAAMKLYDYPASCNCYKVRLLLANLGLEYERVPVDIFGGDTLTDDFAHIS